MESQPRANFGGQMFQSGSGNESVVDMANLFLSRIASGVLWWKIWRRGGLVKTALLFCLPATSKKLLSPQSNPTATVYYVLEPLFQSKPFICVVQL